ncbi:MAG: hypothetical protein IKT16_02015, partial [Desulfovibrio sp.]|nr:hypothetical protein [Desulfovibrio sp.]
MKRASGDSNSHSAVQNQPPTLQREHVQKSPSHLYLRGNVWYFRYALPPRLKKALSCSEIRLSLSTPYVSDARKYAPALRACLEGMLLTEADIDIPQIKAKLNEKLDELIAEQNKDSSINRYTSPYEIRRKINNATKNILQNPG